MTWLADTNVLSEATKPLPHAKAIDWIWANTGEILTCSIVIGELQQGIFQLPTGRRRENLQRWLDGYRGRLISLPFDDHCAVRWASLTADLNARGLAVAVKDSMIAACALAHGLTVATRNVDDFKHFGVPLVNPFA